MVKILPEADTAPVAGVAKRHGVSEQTIYPWRKRFGKLEAHLEAENSKLKKLRAERDLEIDVMKEISRKKMVSARVRRHQVAFAEQRGLSLLRACALLSVARSALRYESRLASTTFAPGLLRVALFRSAFRTQF